MPEDADREGRQNPARSISIPSLRVGYLTLMSSRHSGIPMQLPPVRKDFSVAITAPSPSAYCMSRNEADFYQPPATWSNVVCT